MIWENATHVALNVPLSFVHGAVWCPVSAADRRCACLSHFIFYSISDRTMGQNICPVAPTLKNKTATLIQIISDVNIK